MLIEMEAWLRALLPVDFKMSVGEWVEPQNADEVKYCSLTQEAGPAVEVETRRARFRVILLGRRMQRGDALELAAAANSLIEVAIDGSLVPCGAAIIRAMGEPVGPGSTTEQRAWFSIDFQVTF